MLSLGKELDIQCKTLRKYEIRFQNHMLFQFLELTLDNILVYFLLVILGLSIHKYLYLCINFFTYSFFIIQVTPYHLWKN